MVGTTGAMRACVAVRDHRFPRACGAIAWTRNARSLGGALSNGGEVYAWMKRTLAMPRDSEARLEAAPPGGHGLTVLPFLAGERSPYWRADLRGAITGLSLATEPFDILHASLESISLRFREYLLRLESALGAPAEVIASGGALLHSPAWTQMMADCDGTPRGGLHRTRSFLPRRGAVCAGTHRRDPQSRRAACLHRRDVFSAARIRRRPTRAC